MSLTIVCCMYFWILCLTSNVAGSSDVSLGKGHMEPLGVHQHPEPPIDEVDGFGVVSPPEFHEKYVKGSRPLLFRGGAKVFPAMRKWTDDYLRNNFGANAVTVEPEKKETRSGQYLSMKMSEFLDSYNNEDICLVDDARSKMKDDLVIPKPFVCGGYANLVQAVVVWFSSGGTKSLLHHVDTDNIHCLFDGNKRIFMVDKRQKDKVQRNNWIYSGSHSRIDVEKVDMAANPEMRHVPWYRVMMNKGDCLFIPRRWYHAINSSPARNLAINLWIGHLHQIDKTDCDKKGSEIPLFESMSKWHVTSNKENKYAGGANQLPLEETTASDEEVWKAMFGEFDGYPDVNIRDLQGLFKDTAGKEEIRKFFEATDSNGNGIISPAELEAAPARSLLDRFPWALEAVDDPAGYVQGESQRDEL